MRRCTRCHQQASVTRGTRLAHTHLPFWVHRDLLIRWFLRAPIPRVREVAARYGVSTSTACELIHGMLALAGRSRWRDPIFATVRALLTARRPSRRSVPLTDRAPRVVREIWAGCRQPRPARPLVTINLSLGDRHAGIYDVYGPGRFSGRYPASILHQCVRDWLIDEVRLRLVTIRWLPYWVNGFLAHWSMVHFGGPPLTWIDALKTDHVPYESRDPWADYADEAPWREAA
jgi:hypothetical protein